jgi:hypothetical protein
VVTGAEHTLAFTRDGSCPYKGVPLMEVLRI